MGKDLKGKELGKGLSQRKDGRYSARFVKKNGKRIEKYFPKISLARKWLDDARFEDEHCSISASSQMTVNTWFQYWIENIETPIARYSTVKNHTNRYNKHISEIIGNMILSDVKPMHCQNVLNIMMASDYAPSTIHQIRMTMHVMFEAALENDLIMKNPVKKSVTVKNKSVQKKEPRVLTIEEQKMFLDYAKGSRDYYQYVLMLQTGLRLGEVIGLQWQDVDFQNRVISVKRTMQYRSDIGKFVSGPPKSSYGIRTIPLTQEAFDVLKEIEEKRKQSKLLRLEYKDYVFLNKKGVPTKNTTYNGMLYFLAKKAGIERLSPHTFRHTFATRCIEAGMRPKTLQRILGHSTIHMTMNLYVHVLEDEKTKEMEKFEAYLSGNAEKMA